MRKSHQHERNLRKEAKRRKKVFVHNKRRRTLREIIKSTKS